MELIFTGDVQIQAAGSAGAKLPRFFIDAYTGAMMRPKGFEYPLVVDLSGIEAAGNQIPILLDHDLSKLIGQTDPAGGIDISAAGVRLSGSITGDPGDPDVKKVLTNARNGFQWKASIGAEVAGKLEFVPAGKTAAANGRTIAGPAYIARRSVLRETSFVAIGADSNATAAIAAKGLSMSIETTETTEAPDPIQAERDRFQAIMACTNPTNDREAESFAAIRAKAVAEGWPIETTKKAVLEAHRETMRIADPAIHVKGGGSGFGGGGYGGGRGGGERSGSAIEASLLMRAGREDLAVKSYGERTVEAPRHMRLTSMLDVCVEALRIEGRDPAGMGRAEMIQASLSTLSLPTTLSNVMGKTLLNAYQESTSTWRGFASIKPAADFKPQVGIRPSFIGDLEELGERGEVQHQTMGESTYPWHLDQYAANFAVGRKTVINDDLGFIDTAPGQMAQAASRKINDHVWRLIMLAVTDGFFSVDNGNLLTGALDAAGLGAAVAKMRTQRDDQGRDLQITPRVLVVAPELEFVARALVNSTEIGRTDGGPTGNALRNVAEAVVEPRLSNPRFTGFAADQFFLFGGPSSAPITVGFLDGRQAPIIETFGFDSNPNVLALTFRVVHDFGVAMGDHRAALRSKPA